MVLLRSSVFRGKRHDNTFFKVQILLSRNFVVIAQAPTRVCQRKVEETPLRDVGAEA